MVKISGVQPISNGVSLGYPFIEAVLSVLPIVDEFLINDGGSTDETAFYLKKLQKTFPDKIRLFNRPFYQSNFWETIDDCLLFLIGEAKGDWIFEVQGDEIWHEKDLPELKKMIQKASKENYNSLRLVCNYGNGFNEEFDTRKYRNVRIARKTKGLKTYGGGDNFQTGNSIKPRPGFLCSNLPPELMGDISYYNIGVFAFLKNSLKRARTTFEFFSNKQAVRENIWKDIEQKKYALPRSSQKFENIKEFPAIIQGLIGLEEYQVREELFNKTFLNKLTGLKY